MPHFFRYIGIDYSGAATPLKSLPGLRVFEASGASEAREVLPPPGAKKYWSRRGIAEWLLEKIDDGVPTIVGMDHGLSFPLAYFEKHRLPHDWDHFLNDFCHHWPTDQDLMTVQDMRESGSARSGSARWRRLTEKRSGPAKSVFHFDVPGSVAKSTHAGLPWIAFLRKHLRDSLHCWPFDGWSPAPGKFVIAEVYPSLWSRNFASENRIPDQHDAYTIARWLRETDAEGSFHNYLSPTLTSEEKLLADIEGWILGVI